MQNQFVAGSMLWEANVSGELLPEINPLFDYPMRDISVCPGGDGAYYLIGTTGAPTWWETNDGIYMWKSTDLIEWKLLGRVWSLDSDATWARNFVNGKRAIWAPELHYVNGNYWIAYCMNYSGTGLLRSISGKPTGPYADIKTNGPLTGEIDASLFQDDDGKAYFLYQDGKIALMNDTMTGLAETPHLLSPSNSNHVGFEGAFLTKIDGRYYLLCAEFNNDKGSTYDCIVASSDNLLGPYGDRYLAFRHAGHNMLFKDKKNQWWSTMFGNSASAPIHERPAIFRVVTDKTGKLYPMTGIPSADPAQQNGVYA